MLSFPLFLSSLLTSSKVSMLEMERPAINFLAVKLWNFAERSAMLPRSARLGWSGLAQSGLRVETEEDLERSDMLSWRGRTCSPRRSPPAPSGSCCG